MLMIDKHVLYHPGQTPVLTPVLSTNAMEPRLNWRRYKRSYHHNMILPGYIKN